MTAYLLLILGFALIFIEFFLPGAVMGIFGALLIVASISIFASEANSTVAVVAYIIAVLLGLIYVARLAIKRMQKTGPKQTICSDASQVGYVASSFDNKAVGKRGVVLSDLKPGGYILVEGEKFQALSVSGYISRGTEVEVIAGQEESLIVDLIRSKADAV